MTVKIIGVNLRDSFSGFAEEENVRGIAARESGFLIWADEKSPA